jgi:hypothetical protein
MNNALAEKLLAKWKPMVSHIRSDKKAAHTAAMLEQEHRYFSGKLSEAYGGATVSGAGGAGTLEAPASCDGTAGIARFKAIAMPLVARVFPELVSNDLVGVQPMFTPVGLAYALRYRYQTTAGGATAGDEAGYNTVNALFSGSSPTSATTLPTSADMAAVGNWATRVDNGNVAGGMDQLAKNSGYDVHVGEKLGESYICGAAQDGIRYMGLSVEAQEIVAKTRKLAARWTHEAQQDLQNMHQVDVAQELSDLLAYEIAAEIDAEVKNNIIELSKLGGVLTWNYGSAGVANGSADGRWEQEKFRVLYTTLLKASNEIAVATRRGAGNFVLASPAVVAALEALEAFAPSSVATSMTTEVSGVAKVGQIGRFTVYRDMFARVDYAVVGYKGPRDNDAGLVYCPYVPLMFVNAVGQDSFNPRIGVMTRYGICNNLFGSENYYRYIHVQNLSNSSLAPSVPATSGFRTVTDGTSPF